MATRRQRAKQRQPQPPEPAADYEHIGVVLRLRPLLRWERREGFREAVAKYADAALQVDGPQPKLCRCDKAFDGDTGQREFFRDSGVVPLIDSSFEGFRSTASPMTGRAQAGRAPWSAGRRSWWFSPVGARSKTAAGAGGRTRTTLHRPLAHGSPVDALHENKKHV